MNTFLHICKFLHQILLNHLVDIKIQHSYIITTWIMIYSFIHDPYKTTETHVPVRIFKNLSALSTDGKHRNQLNVWWFTSSWQ